MNGPKNVTAQFTPVYTLTLVASGEGSVSASPPGPSHLAGTVVTVTAAAGSGSSFTGWSGALSGTSTPATLTMNGNKAVTASFLPYYPLTLVAEGGGSVAVSPPGGSYLRGTVVTLTAIPNAGWRFARWSGSISGTANPRTTTVNGPRTVTAVFTQLHSLTLVPSTGGSIVANPAGGSYLPGTVVTLSAVPSPGFAFTGWGGALSGSANPTPITMNASKTVSASFTALYQLGATATSGGSVSVDPPGGSYLAGTVVTLTATPDPGFGFVGWSGSLSGSTNPLAVTLTGHASIVAHFGPLFPLETAATSGGSVSAAPPEKIYPAGTVVVLTARADPGYSFDTWTGDLAGRTNPAALTMDAPKEVTARFAVPEPAEAILLVTALASVRWLARAPFPSRRRRPPGTRGAPARTR
jgi:hypothetical protein